MPLPPVTPAFDASDFNLAVPLTSAFKDLSAHARKHLAGRTIKKEGRWLTVQDIELTGASIENEAGEARGTLVASVAFKAGEGEKADTNIEAEGTLHLTFMPSINSDGRTLAVVDVAATSDTLNLMEAAGVSWINSQFTPEIMAQLTYDYGAQIDLWRPRLNTELEQGIDYEGFTITGELTDVSLGGFHISGSELEVYLSARGKVAAEVDQFSF